MGVENPLTRGCRCRLSCKHMYCTQCNFTLCEIVMNSKIIKYIILSIIYTFISFITILVILYLPFILFGEGLLISRNRIFIFSVVLVFIMIFFIPPTVTGLFYHRLFKVIPDGENRFSLALTLAVIGLCIQLMSSTNQMYLKLNFTNGSMYLHPNRLFNGELVAYEVVFLLVWLVFIFGLYLLSGLAGLSIGLRLTKKKFLVE